MSNRGTFNCLIIVAMVPMIVGTPSGQRTLSDTGVLQDYPNYSEEYGKKYDDPVVVSKRALVLLNKLMTQFKNAVDNNDERGEFGGSGIGRSSLVRSPTSRFASDNIVSPTDKQTMDLQRRGQAKGHVYWRCYFNAVTCFKK